MQHRKLIAATIALLMALSCVGAALAQETTETEVGFSLATGVPENTTIAVGDCFTVNVTLDTAITDFGGVQFSLHYNSDELDYISSSFAIGTPAPDEASVEDDTAITMMTFAVNKVDEGTPTNSTVDFLALNGEGVTNEAHKNLDANTKIVSVVFKAKVASPANSVSLFIDSLESIGSGALTVNATTAAYPSVPVPVGESASYPASTNTADIYFSKIVDSTTGAITVKLIAAEKTAFSVQRMRLSIVYTGYNFGTSSLTTGVVHDDSTKVLSIDYNAANAGIELDANNTIATFTLAPEAGANKDNIKAVAAPSPAFLYGYFLANSDDTAGNYVGPFVPVVDDDPYGGYNYGDVSADGRIDITDAIMILRHSAGITGAALDDIQQIRANVAQDSRIDITDAILILRHSAGYIVKFGIQ